jgi:N-acetylglucosamine-6-sulfatase
MPKLNSLVIEPGLTIPQSFATTPVCCPSRSSIYTGKYIHNINVHNNSAGSGGCASQSFADNAEKENIAHLLSSLAGYSTHFAGKYLNNYGYGGPGDGAQNSPQCANVTFAQNAAGMDNTCSVPLSHVPRGWDSWHALQGNSVYYNYSMSTNGVTEEHGDDYAEDYFIDIVKNRTNDFMAEHLASTPSNPFFAVAAVPAAHEPADPAPQHANYAEGLVAPRTPNYNKVFADQGRHWMASDPLAAGFNASVGDFVDNLYRRRLATLQSVDDMVETFVKTLDSNGALDNTIIVYTSDNGYHLGQFGIPIDKRQPYESDVKVPFFIRGPGIKANATLADGFVTNIDYAPTFLGFAGVERDEIVLRGFDGIDLSKIVTAEQENTRTEFLIEYEGEMVDNCAPYLLNDFPDREFSLYDGVNCGMRTPSSFKTAPLWEDAFSFASVQDSTNNTYTCLRTIDGDVDHQYCEFVTGEVEAFDLASDPYQMLNLAPQLSSEEAGGYSERLHKLKRCEGASC